MDYRLLRQIKTSSYQFQEKILRIQTSRIETNREDIDLLAHGPSEHIKCARPRI